MAVFWIPKRPIFFPDPHEAEPDGLLAVGGDLSVERLLLAYENGIFPWYSFRDSNEPYWYCPHERFVIFPDEVHVSHSMRSLLRKGTYRTTMDQDWAGVLNGCSTIDDRVNQEGAWLGDKIIEAYTRLHELGYAHSVETWDEQGRLVGGLYGVEVNRSFIGESMFSLAPNASKVALVALARHVKDAGGKLIDCQLKTDHLASMGGRFIPYDDYIALLRGE